MAPRKNAAPPPPKCRRCGKETQSPTGMCRNCQKKFCLECGENERQDKRLCADCIAKLPPPSKPGPVPRQRNRTCGRCGRESGNLTPVEFESESGRASGTVYLCPGCWRVELAERRSRRSRHPQGDDGRVYPASTMNEGVRPSLL